MLQINMKGYATIENAMKAATKWLERRPTTKFRWWTVVPTGKGRFVPMIHIGQDNPAWFIGGPFYIVN